MAVELSDVVFKMSDCYHRQYFFTLNNNLQMENIKLIQCCVDKLKMD